MNNMEVIFEVLTQMVLEHDGSGKGKMKYVNIGLNIDGGLDRSAYLNDTTPTKSGNEMITETLIQALIANIHAGKHYKLRDDSEHIRYIIDKLTDGFARVTDVEESKFKTIG